jgi:putative nucleotidyltransferase with HDIG domain
MPEPAMSGNLTAALKALDRYPALRYARERLLDAAGGAVPSTAQLVGAIEADVTLTARILAAANAESDGVTRKADAVLGVPDAVELLGPKRVLAVAEEVPHAGFFARAERISPDRFRLHAVSVRKAAQTIMHTVRPRAAADHVYAVAMLHDIGKLVLALSDPDYSAVSGSGSPALRFRGEREAFRAIDHATMGAALATRWGLPAPISEAIAQHHTPGAGTVSDIVGLADLLAHYAQGHEISGSELAAACEPLHASERTLADLLYHVSGTEDSLTRSIVTQDCPLTRRELATLRALSEGKRYKEIAEEQGISTSTVRTHLHNTYSKLGVPDRAQAVLLAVNRGWL